MQLYLLRHGEAGYAPSDKQRELTERGRKETAQVCQRAKVKLPQPISAVIASTLVRAGQTAAIAKEEIALGTGVELQQSDYLCPETPVADLATFLEQQQIAEPVLLVAHQPLLGKLLSWLCDDPDLNYQVGTSSFFAVEVIAFCRGGGVLEWQLHP